MQNKIFFDIDLALGTGLANKLIDSWNVWIEGLVWVDHSEVRSLPADFSGFVKEVEAVLSDEEVEVRDGSMVVSLGDVEEGLSAIEIEMHSCRLGH